MTSSCYAHNWIQDTKVEVLYQQDLNTIVHRSFIPTGFITKEYLLLAPAPIQSMKHILRLSLVLALVTFAFASGGWAQPIGGPPPCWPPPCIPIDGGLSALIAAGAVLGGKKALELRKSRKKTI